MVISYPFQSNQIKKRQKAPVEHIHTPQLTQDQSDTSTTTHAIHRAMSLRPTNGAAVLDSKSLASRVQNPVQSTAGTCPWGRYSWAGIYPMVVPSSTYGKSSSARHAGILGEGTKEKAKRDYVYGVEVIKQG
jgi:hypothetical protein